jgi:hypothetical protein
MVYSRALGRERGPIAVLVKMCGRVWAGGIECKAQMEPKDLPLPIFGSAGILQSGGKYWNLTEHLGYTVRPMYFLSYGSKLYSYL